MNNGSFVPGKAQPFRISGGKAATPVSMLSLGSRVWELLVLELFGASAEHR